jgi:hypothetical protein
MMAESGGIPAETFNDIFAEPELGRIECSKVFHGIR